MRVITSRPWGRAPAAALLLLIASAGGAAAQDDDRGIRVGVAAGLSAVGSRNPYVGVEHAVHLGLSLERPTGRSVSVALAFDAHAGSTMESIPGCVPEPPGPCEARTEHPGFMLGARVESRVRHRAGRLGGALGAGVVTAPGAKGSVTKSSAVVSAGADLELGDNGWQPVVAVRLTRMLSDVAGVRWIVAPALVLRF